MSHKVVKSSSRQVLDLVLGTTLDLGRLTFDFTTFDD
jgi:hypothetical protein